MLMARTEPWRSVVVEVARRRRKNIGAVNGTGVAGQPSRSAGFVPVNWSRKGPPQPACISRSIGAQCRTVASSTLA
jgi:hypothetical protein